MKNKWIEILLLIWTIAACISCSEDNLAAGSSILTSEDKITVQVDTFDMRSAILPCDSIISWPDSFLLGEMENSYGTMHAQILTQFACPEGFQYPSDIVVDSMEIALSYRTYDGDGNTPMVIDVKRMKETFQYSSSYSTSISIDQYVAEDAPSILEHPKILVASERVDSSIYTDGTYATVVRAKLSDEFVDWFTDPAYPERRHYTTQEDFDQWFKGLYIYSDFGGSTILNVTDIALIVHYSFSYKRGDRDTIVNDEKALYANSEVRQVNAIRYDQKEEVFKRLEQDSSLYNYIVAPANIYTDLMLPMGAIKDSIMKKVGNKRPYVNMAKVRVQVDNLYEGKSSLREPDDWSQPAAYMLLLKAEAFQRFFLYKELPSDTCALLASLAYTTVDGTDDVVYYYEYELASLLTNILRHKEDTTNILDMVLVPVSVQYASSSSTAVITAVKQQQTISATKIYSASNVFSPMSIEVVFSGF